jgi:hypothetical protein
VGAELADGADLDRPPGAVSHVARNRVLWTLSAPEFAEWAPRAWASDEFTWGVWHLPEAEVRALPDLAGKDVVELGCGTAYVSAWARRWPSEAIWVARKRP